MKRFALKGTVLALALGAASLAHAESQIVTGAATASPGAVARVDFTIVIPKILFLRVGTGSTYWTGVPTNNAAIDLITFTVTPAQLGSGTPLAGTGGDLSGGAVTAAVVSNSGNVTLTASAAGALNNGVAADTINWSEITTATATINSASALPAPTLTNGTSAGVVLTAPATKVIKQDARWTYSYANSAIPPAGTYGGAGTALAGVNNGRIVYTATMP